MLYKQFEEYKELRGNKAISIPGFLGFIASNQPDWYKAQAKRDIRKSAEFELISDIIHGHVADGSLDGIYKADKYLSNYHGWQDKLDVKQETKMITQIELVDV